MAGLAYAEQIRFYTTTVSSDSQGGKTQTGESLSLTTFATIKEKSLPKTNTDGQLTFHKALVAEIWKRPDFTVTETMSVEYKGKRYSVQSVTDSDTHNKQLLTLVARV